tara:strand:- start:8580 stop:9521 length:942 start_codon:yes stop_codon:yes gene_type:complete
MDIGQIKEKFKSINEMEGIGLNVYFLLSVEGENQLKRANIIEDVKQDLINAYKNQLKKIVDNEDIALLNLSSADDRKSVLYEYDLEDKPSIFDYFDNIADQANQPDYFNFQNDSLKNLEGYYIYLGDHANNILLYRKQMPINLFRQGKIYLIKDHQTQFDKIKKEFLRIDTKVDVIKIGESVYINNISILERHYEFNDIIVKEATSSLTSIENLEILENIEVLSERIDDLPFARKLSKISTSSPVFNLPKESIIQFVKNHDKLGTEFKYSTDSTQILLDTKKSQNFFLKLMNDDFLHSQLTKFNYVTPAKDQL